jgi:GABA permease
MRNPVRTEAEAFSFTLVIAGLAFAIGIAAWLGGAWVGFGVFLGLALGILAGIFLRSEPKTREPAIWERRDTEQPRRILVVANETCAARGLCDEIRYRARGYDEDVLVVAPALSSHVRYWTSDIDGARDAAQERLDSSLAALAAAGVRARGEVGDADPLQAIEDALRVFGADEIIISTHPPGRSNWLEKNVVAGARARFDLPVTHVVVDIEHEAATIESPEPF